MDSVRELASRAKWAAKERWRALSFLRSADRVSWRREYEACSSAEDLFSFASSRIGIGQNEAEFLRFLAYVEKEGPAYVLEIGVRDGGTSFMFANALKSSRHVLGVDVRLRNIYLLREFCPPWIVKQEFVRGDSSRPSTVSGVERRLGSAKLDVLLIDGDHSYEGVAADFEAYCHLVREGGIIAFHDICMDHFRRYGTETPNDSGDVHRFWRDVRRNYDTKVFFEDEKQNGAGIGAIIWDPSRPVVRLA